VANGLTGVIYEPLEGPIKLGEIRIVSVPLVERRVKSPPTGRHGYHDAAGTAPSENPVSSLTLWRSAPELGPRPSLPQDRRLIAALPDTEDEERDQQQDETGDEACDDGVRQRP
jgi:hypothetical protein